MSGARKPPPSETRNEQQKLLADLGFYSSSSVPGRARKMIENLAAELDMRGVPAGVSDASLTGAAGILGRAARSHNDHDAAGLIRIAQWLERLARQ